MTCGCLIDFADCGYDRVDVLRRTEPVARVAHQCDECDRIIEPGERYAREATISGGEFREWVFCADCDSLQEFICGRLYGGLREQIAEAINCDDIDPSHPAIRALTPSAREWVCDLIEEAWGEDDNGGAPSDAAMAHRDGTVVAWFDQLEVPR